MTDFIPCFARQALRHLTLFNAAVPPLFVVGILILAGCRDEKPAQRDTLRPVRTLTVPPFSSGGLMTQTGELRAHEEIALAFRLEGRVTARTTDMGQHVTAGQVLATLESNAAQNQLSSATADLNSALASERVAALTLHRMKLLMPGGAISRAQLDSAQGDWQVAVSRRQSSEAALKNARDNMAWTQLTAPRDGVITSINVQPGQVVSAAQTVMTLAADGKRDAVFDLAEPTLTEKATTTPIRIALLSNPALKADGQFRDISPQADSQTRTWRLRVTLTNPPADMALGSTVLGTFPGKVDQVIALPASALTRAGERPAVFVVNSKTQQIQVRPIQLTRFDAQQIYLSAGVQPGERVVTAGVKTLLPGERVRLEENDK
ncbi:RND family efflux transporter MFP subunit [Pantoea sp. PA1]|jgi:RND family efflux transporter MFP subunit|uniref:efflux RND transporter periplasmic adaptor subunit n=1 Tax=Pantoea ananas TaxID=553 RepID=UPI001B3074F8|nr:efflux RND transporter periplasmic adaptor subunit [Pantoea ananatis]MCV3298626.1 efflux RND transporter periplasmic adaptor subunit [Pantoea ananatis]MDH0051846.1 efflux RND transporter periplasmic adaptor subunit [Pantoea ananatis]